MSTYILEPTLALRVDSGEFDIEPDEDTFMPLPAKRDKNGPTEHHPWRRCVISENSLQAKGLFDANKLAINKERRA